MFIVFHGVRGSIPVSGQKVVRTGGNTACVELRSGDHRLILDGGTGLRTLGAQLGVTPLRAAIVFSHVHWDHIQGVPFFLPAFHPASELSFVGPPSLPDALRAQMRPPAFPITLDALRARLRWSDAGTMEFGPFQLRSAPVPHPDPCRAWRVTCEGRTIVYATDTELGGQVPSALARLAEGADLLVMDAQYTPEEIEGRRGWGHSSWAEAVHFGSTVGVRRLALFHHDPMREDDAVAVIEADAARRFPGTLAAREGMELQF